MVETVPREPLNFVIGPYDNQKEQYTLQVRCDCVQFAFKPYTDYININLI